MDWLGQQGGPALTDEMKSALDYPLDQINTKIEREMLPSEYYRRNFHACFWFERRNLGNVIDFLGDDNLMFETDFPHVTCRYPEPLRYIFDTLEKLPVVARKKILSGNAAKVYSIDV